MTPSTQASALTDDELLEQVARAVMGWSKRDFVAVIDDAAIRCIDTPGGTERGEAENEYYEFRPLADSNHAKEILVRMRGHWGCTYSIRLLSNGETAVEFIDHHGMIAGQCRHKDHLQAICLAALAAVRPTDN